MAAEVVSRSMRAGSLVWVGESDVLRTARVLTNNTSPLLPSRAPTERWVVLGGITCRGRRSGGTQPSGLPLTLQPVREQSPDEFVEAHPLEVGASTEPTKQRGVEADLDQGRGHVLIVTAEPDRSAVARRSVLPALLLSASSPPAQPVDRHERKAHRDQWDRDPGTDDVCEHRDRASQHLEPLLVSARGLPRSGELRANAQVSTRPRIFSSEVREWRWSARRRRHTAPGPSLQKLR